ncbi:MAG: YARHG domain-containing protein [Faecalimonas umbilicata]
MKCEHCGCELDGNEKFCPLCGANLSNAVKTENKILLGKEKNNKRKWIIAILGIFVLFIIFSCIGVVGYNKQVAEKEAQQEAIQKKREKEQREAEEKAKEEAEEKERKEAEEKAKREAEFIFPYSDTENLTEPQLQSLSQDQLALARNEIIARHGRIFTDEPYKSYFESKSWYQGTIQPQEFDANYETVLNETERK